MKRVSKKGRVMERRLIKDFQIGIVEGIVAEALKSDAGPKNVFAKLATAFGKKASQKDSKKDWNAIVRRSTTKRDPIGRGEGAQSKRSRQSIRRYIIQKNAVWDSMDPERLIEYNPKLSSVSPAIRVAYTKFKMPKIKLEFEQVGSMRRGSESSEIGQPGGSATGDDEVFTMLSPSPSIARPRPRPSSKTSLTSLTHDALSIKSNDSRQNSVRKPAGESEQNEKTVGKSAEKDDAAKKEQGKDEAERATKPAGEEPAIEKDDKKEMEKPAVPKRGSTVKRPAKGSVKGSRANEAEESIKSEEKESVAADEDQPKDFRARTPIPEDPAENVTPPEPPSTPPSAMSPESSSQSEGAENKTTPEVVISKHDDERLDTPKEDSATKKEETRSPIRPTKPGGKSTVTGEILTGWL